MKNNFPLLFLKRGVVRGMNLFSAFSPLKYSLTVSSASSSEVWAESTSAIKNGLYLTTYNGAPLELLHNPTR